MAGDRDPLWAAVDGALETLQAFRNDADALAGTDRFVDLVEGALRRDGRLMACGNGGSMADAMHFAEEWTGRFRRDRPALSAMAFSDPAALTCIANDFGFDQVFARQVEAHGREGDVLVLLSTSGNSENLVRAAEAAARRNVTSVALLGRGGGKLADAVDLSIVVPDAVSADRIQEVHQVVLHAVIEAVERRLFPDLY